MRTIVNYAMLGLACLFGLVMYGDPAFPDEPHTALEDAIDYELPILRRLLAVSSPSEYMNPAGYNWRNYQVKDWFIPK